MHIASFDIGKKNFAFCIEEFDVEKLKKIKNIPKLSRYNDNGTTTPAMEKVLNEVYNNGTIVLHKNVDLTKNCDSAEKLDPETFHNMTELLDSYSSYWDKCDTFVIEEQMSFGVKLNKIAVKLAQHCYSYFAIRYGRKKKIIEYPAFNKTQVLGAPKIEGKPYKSGKIRYKAMEKPARKKWAVQKITEIMENKGIVGIFANIKKKDDLADTFLQLQSYKYKEYVDSRC